ncbi:MAG: WGR domain-containing protein [Minicystis sp.]
MAAPIRLELSDGTSHKFWEGAVEGESLTVRFGRVGTAGQVQTKNFPDAGAAQAALDKLVAEKTRKGYAVKRGESAEAAAPPATKGAAAKGGAKASSGDAELAGVLAELEKVTDAGKRRPATAADLAAIEAVLGSVPADLAALYAFAGNLDAVIGDADGLLDWLDVTGAVGACETQREFETPENLFPIATDNAGNYACFDRDTGRIADWDHETRDATPLSRTLAAYLAKEVLPILRRAQKEKAALAKAKGQRAEVTGMPAEPKKLQDVPNALLRKFDRESYGGGGRDLAFLGDDVFVIGFQNSCSIVEMAKQEEADIRTGGDALVFEPNTNRLLIVAYGVMALADAATKTLTALFKAEGVDRAASAAISPDGAVAAVASNRIQLWDLRGGEGIPKEVEEKYPWVDKLPKGKPMAVLGDVANFARLSFSPDGARLAVGDSKGKLGIWNVAERKLETSVTYEKEIGGVSFALDGASLFVGVESGKVDVLDRGGEVLRSFETGDTVQDLRVLSTGKIAIVGRKALAIVEPEKGRELVKLAHKKDGWRAGIADVRGNLIMLRRPARMVRVV